MGPRNLVFVVILFHVTFNSGCATIKSKHTPSSMVSASLPIPTGPFSIGLKKYLFRDSKRQDPYFSNKLPRDLMINLYYPVDPSVQGEVASCLDPLMLQFYQDEMKKVGLNGIFLNQGYPKIMKEPPISLAQSSYPVIILSPGGGVVPEFYFGVTSELVSQGFIVVAINHTYNAPISVFPDGSTKFQNPVFNQFAKKAQEEGEDAQGLLIKIHSDDISFTLENLEGVDLREHLHLSKIGMIGHSLGGMAVTYSCLHSRLCKAGVNMDGPLAGAPSSILRAGDLTGDLKKPFLFLIGKNRIAPSPKKGDKNYINKDVIAALSKLENLTLEEYYEFTKDLNLGRLVRAVKKMGKNTSTVVFETADHMSFSDWRIINSYLLNDPGKANELRIMKQTISLVTNFFSKNLKGNGVSLLNKMEDKDGLRINSL